MNMEIKIKPIDECEAKVEFEGYILITRASKDEFEKALRELIDSYAI